MTNDLDQLEKDLAILNSRDPNVTTLQRLEADKRLSDAYPDMIQEIKELRKAHEINVKVIFNAANDLKTAYDMIVKLEQQFKELADPDGYGE
jgi:hypothetical protein